MRVMRVISLNWKMNLLGKRWNLVVHFFFFLKFFTGAFIDYPSVQFHIKTQRCFVAGFDLESLGLLLIYTAELSFPGRKVGTC